MELETTVVDEMQSQAGGGGIHGLKKYYGDYLDLPFSYSLTFSYLAMITASEDLYLVIGA